MSLVPIIVTVFTVTVFALLYLAACKIIVGVHTALTVFREEEDEDYSSQFSYEDDFHPSRYPLQHPSEFTDYR